MAGAKNSFEIKVKSNRVFHQKLEKVSMQMLILVYGV